MKKVINKGFTLAEVLITLAIIGVVAALTIPTVVKNYQETAAVSRVKKQYRNVATAVQQWQVEEGCSNDVRNCPGMSSSTRYAFEGIAEKLQIVKTQYGTSGLENVDWLPDYTTLLNGNRAGYAYQGVSKNAGGYAGTCYYLLSDGTTIAVTKESSGNQLYMYIDINGKQAPNRVGKDVFPIGVGAYGSPKYSTVHPNISDDDSHGGVCQILDKEGYCDPDVCTKTLCAPTAYVLKNGKLPPITW